MAKRSRAGNGRLAPIDRAGNARPVRLFDTLTRELAELEPVDGKSFRFYCCGPTVYGPAHIGNFRTFVMQDVLRRALEVLSLIHI